MLHLFEGFFSQSIKLNQCTKRVLDLPKLWDDGKPWWSGYVLPKSREDTQYSTLHYSTVQNSTMQCNATKRFKEEKRRKCIDFFYWFHISYCQSHLPVRRSVWIPVRHTCRRCSTCQRNNKFIYFPPTVDIRIVSIYKNFKIIFNEWKKCKV